MEEVEVGGAGVLGPLVSTGESKQGKRSGKQMGRTPFDLLLLIFFIKCHICWSSGIHPRSGTAAKTLLGETSRTNQEIKAFNRWWNLILWFCRIFVNWWYCFISSFNVILLREYLANNPEYTVSNNNCQGRIFVREKKITFLEMKAANEIYLIFTYKF